MFTVVGCPSYMIRCFIIFVILADAFTSRVNGPGPVARRNMLGDIFHHGLRLKIISYDTAGWGFILFTSSAAVNKTDLAARFVHLRLPVMASENFTVSFGKTNDFTRRFLFTLNGLSVGRARSVSLSLLFLFLT